MIKKNSFCSKYVNVLPKALTAESHLAERQILLKEQILNTAKYLICCIMYSSET